MRILRLDRSSIEHTDFSITRRGYDPAEVRQRLGEIADAIEARRTDEHARRLSSAAEEQVRRIAEVTTEQLRAVLEAAEQSARDVCQRAEAEATRITEEARQRATETDEGAADVCQQAEAEATRIIEEAHRRAVETDEWAEQQAVSVRHAIAAAEALADRMGAGASAIGADLEAITSVLEARPPRPALNSPAMAGDEPRSPLALPETAGPGAGATSAGDRSDAAQPASGGGKEPGDLAETATPKSPRRSAASEEELDPAPGEQEAHDSVEGREEGESEPQGTGGASRRQRGAASAGTNGQSSPEASLHHRSWKMRTTAFEMAVGGADRGEVARHLYAEFQLNDDDDAALVDSTIEEAFQNLEDTPPDERPRMLRRMFGG